MSKLTALMTLLMIVLSAGCMQASTNVTTDPELSADLPPYNGPRARMAVAKFDWKVGQGGGGVQFKDSQGNSWSISSEQNGYLAGLESMLNTALVQTKRFSVLERENFDSIKEEIAMGEEGYMEEETRVNKGHVKGADIQVVAAITGWEPGTSEKKGGIGGLFGGKLGGVKIGVRKSSMAMDLRIYDTRTSEILYATTVRGEAKDVSFGGLGGGFMGGIGMIGGLAQFEKTPMEKAIRACIRQAVLNVADNVPQSYFVY